MGEMIEFKSNGDTANGYLARPQSGSGPGVLVLQEWWGLVPQIKGVCDRLATEGFVALAPDLYHGEIAEHTEMDKAGELMNAMPPERAARDMGAAIDALLAHPAVTSDRVGVIGFCMGGLLTLMISALQGDRIGAAVPYYGYPPPDMAPDWAGLSAPVLAHIAENDDFFSLEGARALEGELKGAGKDVTFVVYEGAGHAFANEEDPLGNHHPEFARQAWDRSIEFLRANLI
jgi:carboxymethylenebutenolidase